jgi:ligand-binding sensor domain-containing protein
MRSVSELDELCPSMAARARSRRLRSRVLPVLLLLASLVLATCAGGTPTPTGLAAPTGASTHRPVPSPSAFLPATATAEPVPLPATIDAMSSVATEIAPGWARYDSINEVLDLAFAPDGGLWASTTGGLVRWDLNSGTYTRYLILTNRLAVAPDSTLWLNSEYGLCRFDGASCDRPPDLPEFMASDLYALDVTAAGDLWVGGAQGASRFDGTSWTGYPLGVAVYDLDASYEGGVWAATTDGVALYREADDSWTFYAQVRGLPNTQVQAVGVSPAGEAWAYIAWEGLYRLGGDEWQLVQAPPGGNVREIAFAADGKLWVGTVGGSHYPGGTLSSWDGDTWIDVSSAAGLISFRAVAPGPDGAVAAATSLGLGIYESGEWRMLKDGPTSGPVASVAVTPDGSGWFAFGDQSLSTNGSGLSQFDGEQWHYHLGDAEVTALAVAPDGSLWAGVGCGIQRFDSTAWETLARCDEELPPGNVLDIEFAADGSTWVATGLNLVRFDGEAWIPYDKLVHAVVAAPDGAVWVNGWGGSQGSQYVARFDGGEWTTYSIGESFAGTFSVSAVTGDGRVWGIVPDRGLAAFDGRAWSEAESWAFYAPPEGVLLHGGSGPYLAPDGALWMHTQHGVARFDPTLISAEAGGNSSKAAWTIYRSDDGLEGSSLGPIAFGPDGEIWLGATRFQPIAAGDNSESP